ncbi:MAG: hypothetical protein WA156_06230, partial [Methylocystis silviterrae]
SVAHCTLRLGFLKASLDRKEPPRLFAQTIHLQEDKAPESALMKFVMLTIASCVVRMRHDGSMTMRFNDMTLKPRNCRR